MRERTETVAEAAPDAFRVGYYDTSLIDRTIGPWLTMRLAGTPQHWAYVFRCADGDPESLDWRRPWPEQLRALAGRYQGFWCAPEALPSLPWRPEF